MNEYRCWKSKRLKHKKRLISTRRLEMFSMGMGQARQTEEERGFKF
jgi:hypothetical protein